MEVINANEKGEFVTVDTTNEFIQTNNPKQVGHQKYMMKIRGKLAQIFVEIVP